MTTLLWPSALCLSCSPGLLNQRPRGPAFCWVLAFSTTSYHQLVWSPNSIGGPEGPFGLVWLSLPHLVSNSVYFLSSPRYIIVQSPTQSPTQSLEWHVWTSSSGNNCHAVQRSLSSGASVYECIMGFYLIPFHQPNPPTRFLSVTGHWNVSLPSGASLYNGMFGRVEGQYTTLGGMAMKGYPHITQSSRCRASTSDAVLCHTQDTSSIWSIDGTLTDTTTPNYSGPECYSNEPVVHIP